MDASHDTVIASLAELSDGQLAALRSTTEAVPQLAPGLLAWLDHVADWEEHRRRGINLPLHPPEAAIPPEEDAVSIDIAVTLRAIFAQDSLDENRAVVALLDAVVGLLTGTGRTH
jgi:hypothetical protein